MSRSDCQQGSATVFGIAVIAVVATVGVMLVAVLGAVAVRIETETAADAAALAAVAAAVEGRAPRPAAARVAEANGAKVVGCRCPAFSGRSFWASVVVERDVRMPLLGGFQIRVERRAEYAMDP